MTDRELDALVAEHVFGMTHDDARNAALSEVAFAGCYEAYRIPVHMPNTVRYSTTGDGMLAVIENMVDRCFDYDIGGGNAGGIGPYHKVEFRTRADVLPAMHGSEMNDCPLPRVVALAALRAIGVEVPA